MSVIMYNLKQHFHWILRKLTTERLSGTVCPLVLTPMNQSRPTILAQRSMDSCPTEETLPQWEHPSACNWSIVQCSFGDKIDGFSLIMWISQHINLSLSFFLLEFHGLNLKQVIWLSYVVYSWSCLLSCYMHVHVHRSLRMVLRRCSPHWTLKRTMTTLQLVSVAPTPRAPLLPCRDFLAILVGLKFAAIQVYQRKLERRAFRRR